MAKFDRIAQRYDYQALVQASAGEQLLAMARPRVGEIVLDLGCGPGRFSRAIRRITGAPLVGLDASQDMINQARLGGSPLGLEYCVATAEEMALENYFDLVFCNSAFQWFTDPPKVLAKLKAALKPSGRLAVQSPATENYCPQFIKALESIKASRKTGPTFEGYRSAWFFLESAEAYTDLFEASGYAVVQSTLKVEEHKLALGKAMEVFESGAAAGYLNPAHYQEPYSGDYEQDFREVFAAALAEQADAQGKITLEFSRVYLLALP